MENIGQINKVKKPNNKKLFWIIAGFVLAMATLFVVLWVTGVLGNIFRSKDVLGSVGGRNITKQDVEKTSREMTEAGFFEEEQSQTLGLIMDYWLYTLAAKKYGIEVNDRVALDYLKSELAGSGLGENLDMNNNYVRYRAYRDYLRDEFTTLIESPQKGAYILAHYDQNFGQATPELKALSKAQYDALLKADRDYATNFINDVYAKLKAGSITFEQGMQMQLQDKVIGENALPTAIQSQAFGVKQASNGEYVDPISGNPQVKSQIEKLKAGEISEPFILKVPPGMVPTNDLVDGIWMIVKVDSINSKLPKFDSLAAAWASFKKDYKYVIYQK